MSDIRAEYPSAWQRICSWEVADMVERTNGLNQSGKTQFSVQLGGLRGLDAILRQANAHPRGDRGHTYTKFSSRAVVFSKVKLPLLDLAKVLEQ